MSLNISLIVHGVPMGQKIWGAKSDDERYISSFYGPKWDAPEVMKVEVMTFGSNTNCYYTFVKGQNVFDSQGRAGSYFALTLKMNSFYADIQNLYAILKAAYDKICVGLCVKETNGSVKFKLADFQNVDNELKELEKQILGYISEYSVNSDIVGLDSLLTNSQTSTRTFNLHECSKNIAIKAIKQYGRLSVSPWYLSESASQTVKRYKDESLAAAQKAREEIELQKRTSQQQIERITLQLQNEIEAIKKQSSEELSQYKEKSRIQISQVQAEKDKKIEEIKNRYAEVDLKINSFKDIIKEKDKEISKLRQLNRHGAPTPPNGGSSVPIRPYYDRNKRLRRIIYCVVFFIIILLFLLLLLLYICKIFPFSTNENKHDYHDRKELKSEKRRVKHKKRPLIFIEEFTKGKNEAVVGKLYHVSITGVNNDDTKGVLMSDEFKIESNTIIAKRNYLGKKGTIYYMVKGIKKDSIEIQIKDSI